MKNEILDEDFTLENSKQKGNDVWFEALSAVLVASFIYFFILMIFDNNLGIANPATKAVVEDSLSIIHLLIAMFYFNSVTAKGNYKSNIKGGYYILLFGSGLFFIGASISLIQGIIRWIGNEGIYNFWWMNYKHIITLLVIFAKFILIKPIASIFSKTKEHVPTKR